MDQTRNLSTPTQPYSYYGMNPLDPYFLRIPQSPNVCQGVASCATPQNRVATNGLSYWQLLYPALFGAVGAILLSLFCFEKKNSIEHFEGTLFKLALVAYALGSAVSVSFAITKVLADSRPPYDKLFRPIGGALIAVILLFAAEYLLLYRTFPSSFKGDVGNDFCTQLFSFIYLSTTTLATAGLGDIMPNNVTGRALIAIEIGFYLFTMATAVQLILVQKS